MFTTKTHPRYLLVLLPGSSQVLMVALALIDAAVVCLLVAFGSAAYVPIAAHKTY
jgi:hypothetical protein